MASESWARVPSKLADLGYQVQCVLGEGGFGRAYRVQDFFATTYVVKATVAPRGMDADGVVRAKADRGRIAARLQLDRPCRYVGGQQTGRGHGAARTRSRSATGG